MGIRAFGYHAAFGFLKAFGMAAAATGMAFAVPAQSPEQVFAGFVQSPPYKDYLVAAFNGTEPPPLKTSCAKLDLKSLDPPLVLKPVSFNLIKGSYHPKAGAWVARATLNRCGKPTVRRLLMTADEQTGLHAKALIPGEFPGNLQLENDAARIVLPGMMGVARCSDYKSLWVLDTRLTSPAKPEGWSETWTAQACGRTMTADVFYTADATGMNITARNIKVH